MLKFVLSLLVVTMTLGQPARAQPASIDPSGAVTVRDWIDRLKPGEYLWWPQLAPSGPIIMMINRTTQRAVLYRNGVPIGVSTISTGRAGHRTPAGSFVILEKQARHFSSIYDSAPMPFMQRLTWGGVALHGGQLPGYPASHGCIRLPLAFARLIYAETRLGMTVVITDATTLPSLMLNGDGPGNDDPSANDAIMWDPLRAPDGPITIIASVSDGRALIMRNGHLIGAAPVTLAAPVDRPRLFVLASLDAAGEHWQPTPLNGEAVEAQQSPWELLSLPDQLRSALQPLLGPSVRLVIVPDHVAS